VTAKDIKEKGKISYDEVVNVMSKNSNLDITTAKRRTQTIFRWFKWIEKNLGIIQVKKKTIFNIST
jgi:hypothetical protein